MTTSAPFLILPLYKKGTEKECFDRAILWLRRDVQQILVAVGLEYDAQKNISFNINKVFLSHALYDKISF